MPPLHCRSSRHRRGASTCAGRCCRRTPPTSAVLWVQHHLGVVYDHHALKPIHFLLLSDRAHEARLAAANETRYQQHMHHRMCQQHWLIGVVAMISK